MTATLDSLRASYEAAGQGHVFDGFDALEDSARASFLAELAAIDLPLVERLALKVGRDAGSGAAPTLEPAEAWPHDADGNEAARAHGAELLAAGKVGFVLVAGGQGSRLGYDGPKGAYSIGPVTDRCLFDWHAARIQATGTRHGFAPVWYVMTSRANDAATRAFFAEHDRFGFAESDVVFFSQDMLPALDLEGRIVLSAPGEVFLAPNGHGGTLAALRTSGALDDMARRGIEQLSYFQVDNPLARPGDTLFLGAHASSGADMSSKVVPKRDAEEKVGVIGRVNGALGCIEYSDLSDELRYAKADDGRLLFNAGNIAVHALRRDFVERLTEGGDLDLPWHVAKKALTVMDASGATTKIDGVKFETFVFDALGKAERSVTMEVERAQEFSPVKNAEGSDSPDTCRADLDRIGREILGTSAPADGPVEVDPRAAETPDEFTSRTSTLTVLKSATGTTVTAPR
ncbi:MAG: UTP--glucose-1-phosphate uridylyltransferase [Planctomycetota bacterium]